MKIRDVITEGIKFIFFHARNVLVGSCDVGLSFAYNRLKNKYTYI